VIVEVERDWPVLFDQLEQARQHDLRGDSVIREVFRSPRCQVIEDYVSYMLRVVLKVSHRDSEVGATRRRLTPVAVDLR